MLCGHSSVCGNNKVWGRLTERRLGVGLDQRAASCSRHAPRCTLDSLNHCAYRCRCYCWPVCDACVGGTLTLNLRYRPLHRQDACLRSESRSREPFTTRPPPSILDLLLRALTTTGLSGERNIETEHVTLVIRRWVCCMGRSSHTNGFIPPALSADRLSTPA